VATFLSYRMLPHQLLNGSLKYWSSFFLLFCLRVKNVATSAFKWVMKILKFFSYYSAYKTKILPHQPLNGSLKYGSFLFPIILSEEKMFPHQPLNGSLKYWSLFSLLFCLWGKNVPTSAFN
jgi:hypothetical protein